MKCLALLLLLIPLTGAAVMPEGPLCTHGEIFVNASELDQDRCFYYATPPGKGEAYLGLEDNCPPLNLSWAEVTELTDSPIGNWSFRIFYLKNDTNGTFLGTAELQPPVTSGSLEMPDVLVQGEPAHINATWTSKCSVQNFTVYLHSIFGKPVFYNGPHSGGNHTEGVWLEVGRVKGTHVFSLKYDYFGETTELEGKEAEVSGSQVTIEDFRVSSNDETVLTLEKVGDGARLRKVRITLVGNETVNRTVYNRTELPTGNYSIEITRTPHKTTVMDYPSLLKVQSLDMELSSRVEVKSAWEESFLEEGLPPGRGFLASINLTIYDEYLEKGYYVVKNLTGVVENVCGEGICGPGECETCPDDCSVEECPAEEEAEEVNETIEGEEAEEVNETIEEEIAENETIQEEIPPISEPEPLEEPEIAAPRIPSRKKAAAMLIFVLIAFAALLVKSMGRQLGKG